MDSVLVYSDSLTWGIIPNTRNRLPFDERWPGVLENSLNDRGHRVRVIEDCLNGRRTVWDDPFKQGRNGLQGLAQRIEIHSPLSLVILMLGTNDFQFSHPYNNAWSAAQGLAALVNEIRRSPIEPGMPMPPILVVSPPGDPVSQGGDCGKVPRRRRQVCRSRGRISRGRFKSGLSFLRRGKRHAGKPGGRNSPGLRPAPRFRASSG